MTNSVEIEKTEFMMLVECHKKLLAANNLLIMANQIIASTPYGKQWRLDYKSFKTDNNDSRRV